MNEALKSLVIDAQTSIHEPLRAIDRSKRQIALAVDGDGVLQAMGTAEALSLLNERLDGPFIMMNGDLLAYHRELDEAGTIVVREYEYQIPYGVVRSANNLMSGIEEKPTVRYFVHGGIYVLSPDALDHVVAGSPLDMPILLTQIKEADREVGVFSLRDYWRGIGQVDYLEAARSEFDSVFTG